MDTRVAARIRARDRAPVPCGAGLQRPYGSRRSGSSGKLSRWIRSGSRPPTRRRCSSPARWWRRSPSTPPPAFVDNEFLQTDVNKWAQLARASRPANGLYAATQGNPESSARYREILAPLHLGDELRAALLDGSSCWGFMCLHREQSSPGFTPEDVALRQPAHPAPGRGLAHRAADRPRGRCVPESDGPGLLVLADDLSVVSDNDADAERWLAETADWPRRSELPQAIYGMLRRCGCSSGTAPLGPTSYRGHGYGRLPVGGWSCTHHGSPARCSRPDGGHPGGGAHRRRSRPWCCRPTT